jgi:hypothetical protein
MNFDFVKKEVLICLLENGRKWHWSFSHVYFFLYGFWNLMHSPEQEGDGLPAAAVRDPTAHPADPRHHHHLNHPAFNHRQHDL